MHIWRNFWISPSATHNTINRFRKCRSQGPKQLWLAETLELSGITVWKAAMDSWQEIITAQEHWPVSVDTDKLPCKMKTLFQQHQGMLQTSVHWCGGLTQSESVCCGLMSPHCTFVLEIMDVATLGENHSKCYITIICIVCYQMMTKWKWWHTVIIIPMSQLFWKWKASNSW